MAGFFWQPKKVRAELNKKAYFKCRQERTAKGKLSYPHPGAPKIGACKDKFVDWQRLDPSAAAKVKAEGLKAVAWKGDKKKAANAKAKYLSCRRKWHARKKSAYPQHTKWPYRCKSEYVAWKKWSPKEAAPVRVVVPKAAMAASILASRPVSRPRPRFAAQAGAARVPVRAGAPVAPFPEEVPADFVPSDSEDMVMASEEEILDMPIEGAGYEDYDEGYEDEDLDEDLDEESDEFIEGVPNWMLAAGAIGGLGLLWFMSGR